MKTSKERIAQLEAHRDDDLDRFDRFEKRILDDYKSINNKLDRLPNGLVFKYGTQTIGGVSLTAIILILVDKLG